MKYTCKPVGPVVILKITSNSTLPSKNSNFINEDFDHQRSFFFFFSFSVYGTPQNKVLLKSRPLEPKWLLNPGSATYQLCDLEHVI